MAHKPGRPLSLDEIKQEVAIGLAAVGCQVPTIARYLGVHPQTIRNAARRDAEFGRRLTKAQASLELSHLRKVTTASGRSWRASAWMLERLNPGKFRRRPLGSVTRQELDAVVDLLAQVLVEEVPDAASRRHVLRRLEQLQRSIAEQAAA